MLVWTIPVLCSMHDKCAFFGSAGSPIDITDPSWGVYLAVESTKDDHGDVGVKLLGFAASYKFYYYPDSSRLRLSQVCSYLQSSFCNFPLFFSSALPVSIMFKF